MQHKIAEWLYKFWAKVNQCKLYKKAYVITASHNQVQHSSSGHIEREWWEHTMRVLLMVLQTLKKRLQIYIEVIVDSQTWTLKHLYIINIILSYILYYLYSFIVNLLTNLAIILHSHCCISLCHMVDSLLFLNPYDSLLGRLYGQQSKSPERETWGRGIGFSE